MYDPKETVENPNDDVINDSTELNVEQENRPVVDDHGRGPNQPVYGDSYEEEYAEETATVPVHEPAKRREQETNMQEDVKVGIAWIGLSAAILSFFFAPIILGAAGIILGVIGKRRGADALGNMAIIISVVSILFALFFSPFYDMI